MPEQILQAARIAKGAIHKNWWFHIFSAAAILLIITSFIVPPMGVIDGSILGAVGELFGFAALGTVVKAIDRGMDAKITHGETAVEINNDNE